VISAASAKTKDQHQDWPNGPFLRPRGHAAFTASCRGHEQSLRISVAVSAGIGRPSGAVLVDAGATAVHPIRLGSGAGSYTLGCRQLKPGTYHLVARYVGDPYFRRSTSGQRTLTVVK
jgi:hypothetical protein